MPGNHSPCEGMTIEQKADFIAGAGCVGTQLGGKRFKKTRERALLCLEHTALEAADKATGCDDDDMIGGVHIISVGEP